MSIMKITIIIKSNTEDEQLEEIPLDPQVQPILAITQEIIQEQNNATDSLNDFKILYKNITGQDAEELLENQKGVIKNKYLEDINANILKIDKSEIVENLIKQKVTAQDSVVEHAVKQIRGTCDTIRNNRC